MRPRETIVVMLLAQDYSYSTGGSPIGAFIGAIAAIFFIVTTWRIFTKAGQPGWAAIVPFYNYYVLLKVVGRPGWWLILYFIPFVNLVIYIIVVLDLAKVFGKGSGFAVGLILLPFIFFPILAFGSAGYS